MAWFIEKPYKNIDLTYFLSIGCIGMVAALYTSSVHLIANTPTNVVNYHVDTLFEYICSFKRLRSLIHNWHCKTDGTSKDMFIFI